MGVIISFKSIKDKKGGKAEMKPIIGKRYYFPLSIPPDGRMKSGLVETVDDHGIATLITRDGQRWRIPCENLVCSWGVKKEGGNG